MHTITLGVNIQFEHDIIRYSYASLTTPRSAIDYDMQRREQTVVKQPGAHRPLPLRLRAPVGDRRRRRAGAVGVVAGDLPVDGSAPCLLYGYGPTR